MRRDVRYGTVLSMIIVLVVGGLWLFRTEPEKPIPVASPAGQSAGTATKEPARTTPRRTPAPGPRTADTQPAARPSGPIRGTVPPSTSAGAARPVGESGSAAPASTDTPTRVASRPTGDSAQPRPADRSQTTPGELRTPERSPSPDATTPTAPAPSPRLADATPRPAGTTPSTTLPAGNQPGAAAAPQHSSAPDTAPNPVMLTARTPATAAPTPRPAVAAQPAAMETHRVQPGDTLSSLSQAYYGSERFVTLLREANSQIDDPTMLRVGSVIRIPPAPEAATATTTPAATTRPAVKRTYEVKSGDSFYAIARDQLGNAARWKELLALNNDLVKGDPTRLRPGQIVVLPES